ncbi:glutathione peroxidase [Pseudoalteromonas lipolytica]|uniref:glutathione peroxidase n=1 Tax=Pseudoalteromonas lipolytica TaxID=570156 RepID=UPI003A96D20E
MDSIYRFNAQLASGEDFSLASLQGKTTLIVNIASKCNFSMQMASLEKLYNTYKDHNFTVLGFACNQFGHNEPLEGGELLAYYQQHFNVSFPLFNKVLVNGPEAHPLFNYLKCHTRGIAQNRAIKWNFTKFLINSEGQLIARYAPRTKPETLKMVIESNLNDKAGLIQCAKI